MSEPAPRPHHPRLVPRIGGPGAAGVLGLFLALAALLLAALGALPGPTGAGPPPRGPNVVLITADTLRADHLGSYGYLRSTSPNLDRLASRGTRFTHAVAQWPKTSPSIASLFTGQYGHRHGVRRTRQALPETPLVLAELLREHAYRTAAVVTNANLSREYGFDQGFDLYVEIWRRHPGQDAEPVSDAALSWLRTAAGGGPFFLWLHYSDPHAYYGPPEPYHELFVGDGVVRGLGHAPLNPGKDDDMGGIPVRARLGERTDLDYYVAQYDAEIRYMDAQIGRVLAALRERGIEDRTLVVFTADHGESLGEHDYYFEHGRLPYDASFRVPLLMAGPGIPRGAERDGPAELIAVMPTLLELLDLPPHPDAQAASLLDPELDGQRLAFSEAGYRPEPQRTVRDGRWKLIYVPDPRDRALMRGGPFELYDLLHDPGERRDLFVSRAAVAARLQRELFAWMDGARNAPEAAPAPGRLDPATEEALRSLGYLR